eukprot:jgi/Botrbrau1/20616/Bobra.113_1s0042.1
MYPNEGTPTTPLMQRAQHRRSSSAGLPAMDMTMQVQCRGIQGQVTLSADGTVEFTPEQELQGFWNCFHYRRRETRQSQVNKEFFASTSGQGFTTRTRCPPPIVGTRLTESWRHSVLYASLITAYKAWCLKSYIIKRRLRLLQALSVSYPGSDIIGGTLVDNRTLQIWYFTARSHKGRIHRYLKKSPPFQCTGEAEAERWLQSLQSIGSWRGSCEPRKLVIVINPSSGSGRAAMVFRTQVLPILEAGGLECIVHETKHRGHATEIVKELQSAACDAIVGVGGDGTIFEILQGYFDRPDWKEAVTIPFVQVPAGSGNALSANTGMWTAEAAAFAICKGRTSPIDIISFFQSPKECLYAFLSSTYGVISNLDVGTDNLRWMGQTRFTIGAIKEIFKRSAYGAIVAYLPARSQAAALDTVQDASDQASSNGPSVHQILPFLQNPGFDMKNLDSLPQGWTTLPTTSFGIFAACNLKWLETNTPMAPEADLNTGCLDIIYTSNMGFGAAMDVFTKIDTDVTKSRCVHVAKASAFVLEPTSAETETALVVDGEIVPFRRIHGQVHPGLCQVIVA